jgi:hypothetical protein
MDFDIKPYVGVGPITFGVSSEKVRKTLRAKAEAVNKGCSGIPADFFTALGIFVYYRQPGVCQALEFAGPASPTFRSQHLLGRSYREIEQWVKTLDPEVVLGDAGMTSYKFGFGLYAPSARKKPDLPVKGVIVFEKGYYDCQRA